VNNAFNYLKIYLIHQTYKLLKKNDNNMIFVL